MNWQAALYVLALLSAAATTDLLALYAWRRRTVPCATPFFLTMLLVTLCCLASALETIVEGLPSKLFWANVQYFSYAFLPVTMIMGALEYTGRDHLLTRRRLVLLCVIPAITLTLLWTNDWHHLVRAAPFIESNGYISVVGKSFGPWYLVHAIFCYGLFGVTMLILADAAFHAPPHHRGQPIGLLAGSIPPVFASLSYSLGTGPARFDQTQVAFAVMGLILAWSIFRHRTFNLVPLAHHKIVEGMNDGVVVLDAAGQVVEMNPAASRILGLSLKECLGRPGKEVLDSWPVLVKLSGLAVDARVGMELATDDSVSHFDVQVSMSLDRNRRIIGKVIALRDLTEQQKSQQRLVEQQKSLAVFEERDRLARELHDSLGQVLGYVNTQAQAVRTLLVQGDTARADSHLARLVAVTQDAHADVREFILNMKSPARLAGGLVPALESSVRRFQQLYGITAQLTLPERLEDDLISPEAEVQLLRIVQEALANVRKHARARRALVTLSVQADHLLTVVEDDGCGFDPARLPDHLDHSFGMRIMNERASEVGGSLSVQGIPGMGTKVIVQIPFRKETSE
ncbi:MAG TPA: histidine kinase N-terminal 7TM domain-containing protein [Chloroflexota bacterium]|nr:histidine kinase N-terminal 7TM domain-containing protein [Chloroflexota bacterium]